MGFHLRPILSRSQPPPVVVGQFDSIQFNFKWLYLSCYQEAYLCEKCPGTVDDVPGRTSCGSKSGSDAGRPAGRVKRL